MLTGDRSGRDPDGISELANATSYLATDHAADEQASGVATGGELARSENLIVEPAVAQSVLDELHHFSF